MTKNPLAVRSLRRMSDNLLIFSPICLHEPFFLFFLKSINESLNDSLNERTKQTDRPHQIGTIEKTRTNSAERFQFESKEQKN